MDDVTSLFIWSIFGETFIFVPKWSKYFFANFGPMKTDTLSRFHKFGTRVTDALHYNSVQIQRVKLLSLFNRLANRWHNSKSASVLEVSLHLNNSNPIPKRNSQGRNNNMVQTTSTEADFFSSSPAHRLTCFCSLTTRDSIISPARLIYDRNGYYDFSHINFSNRLINTSYLIKAQMCTITRRHWHG